MENKIVQDYSKSMSPEKYNETLPGHQYIGQSDHCIRNIVKRFYEQYMATKHGKDPLLLDLGCGPGRKSASLRVGTLRVVASDISETFIDYARQTNSQDYSLSFVCEDFTKMPEVRIHEKGMFDIIVMQGVMHHIHGNDRGIFKKKCHDLLAPDGILIISDEFIKDYKSDDERIMNVAKFYLHIIAEALKGGFEDLAQEEAKNLVDDCFSGTEHAGLMTPEIYSIIAEFAKDVNNAFYRYGYVGMDPDTRHYIDVMFDRIKNVLYGTGSSVPRVNRGDLKVSQPRFVVEMERAGFKMRQNFKIGPVDELGGMGVLVFKKK